MEPTDLTEMLKTLIEQKNKHSAPDPQAVAIFQDVYGNLIAYKMNADLLKQALVLANTPPPTLDLAEAFNEQIKPQQP